MAEQVLRSPTGFIGLGNMGYEIGLNIRKKLDKSATLYVTDKSPEQIQKFVAAASGFGPVEVLPDSNGVMVAAANTFVSVPGPPQIRDIFLNSEHGLISANANVDWDSKIYIDLSTIDKNTAVDVAKGLAAAHKGRYIDCPVSGGTRGAKAATLATMIGINADSPDVDRIRACASMVGNPQRIFLCGSTGDGSAAKLTNNYLAGTMLTALSEAMNLGLRQGLDRQILYNVIHESTGQSYLADNTNPVSGLEKQMAADRDYAPTFALPLMLKDMTLALDAAKQVGAQARVGKEAHKMYSEAAEDNYCKTRDVTSIYKYIGGK